MSDVEVIPELKQIVGAMLFGSQHPLSPGEIRRVLKQVAETDKGVGKDFAAATEKDIREAVRALTADLESLRAGFQVVEIAGGYRLVNDGSCGPWLRQLLDKGRPARLSQPALETLAIIAYRQPCTRSEIEAVRGVEVDQMVRNLLELQLIRLMGRSELPGRPWLLGTTPKFMEHFGINSLDDLPGIVELRRMETEQLRKQDAESATEPAVDEPQGGEDTQDGVEATTEESAI